jgi:hypothetical protein
MGGPHWRYLHSALPDTIPEGAIVAEVEFESADADAFLQEGVRARIRRMVQGSYGRPTLIVRPKAWSSCDSPLGNGSAGVLVAIPYARRDGEWVVHPIAELEPGYTLPEAHYARRRPKLPPLEDQP